MWFPSENNLIKVMSNVIKLTKNMISKRMNDSKGMAIQLQNIPFDDDPDCYFDVWCQTIRAHLDFGRKNKAEKENRHLFDLSFLTEKFINW